MVSLQALVGLICLSTSFGFRFRSTVGAPAGDRSSLTGYSFAEYTRAFGRDYKEGTAEYQHRAELFEVSLAEIHAVNEANSKSGRSWFAGVHPFMDWTEGERSVLHGYRRTLGRSPVRISTLQESMNTSRVHIPDVSTWLQDDSDRADSVPQAIRNQGHCGSCWAIAAAEAVEAQLNLRGAGDVRVSAQALVNCVPNPHKCGGDGGCKGATSELALQFIKEHGIPLDEDLPYSSGLTHKAGDCPLTADGSASSGAFPTSGKRVRVGGFVQLPSNQVEPLKQAVFQRGPTVVAVDARGWHNYQGGIYDSCDKDAVLGHAVLAKGWDQDSSGKKYWVIQNSWSSMWGEAGFIRVLRHENDRDWCGMDRRPLEGVGCEGGPDEVEVCGMCGILYDGSFPDRAWLEQGQAPQVSAPVPSAEDSTTDQSSPDLLPVQAPQEPVPSQVSLDTPSSKSKQDSAEMVDSDRVAGSAPRLAGLSIHTSEDTSEDDDAREEAMRRLLKGV